MNLFFYLQTFILDYSFIVILSDHIFVLCFIKIQPFVKRKPVKTEKNTGTIAFRFRQVLLCIYIYIYIQGLYIRRTCNRCRVYLCARMRYLYIYSMDIHEICYCQPTHLQFAIVNLPNYNLLLSTYPSTICYCQPTQLQLVYLFSCQRASLVCDVLSYTYTLIMVPIRLQQPVNSS